MARARKAYTLLIRFVFNLKRLLAKVGVRGPIGSAAAAAIAFLKEEYPNNLYIEQEVYKYLKEQGFQFDMSEDYGEPLVEGTYKVKHDIYNLDGDKIINSDEDIIYTNTTHTIMGYDVFKEKNKFYFSSVFRGEDFGRNMYVFSVKQVIRSKMDEIIFQLEKNKFGKKVIGWFR